MYLVKCKEKKRRKKNRISSNTNTDTKTQRELLNLLGQCIVWRNRENQQGVELIRCLQRRHFSSLFIYVGHHACSRSIDCNRKHTQLSQSVGETKCRWNNVALTLESVQNVLQCDHKGRFCSEKLLIWMFPDVMWFDSTCYVYELTKQLQISGCCCCLWRSFFKISPFVFYVIRRYSGSACMVSQNKFPLCDWQTLEFYLPGAIG